MCVFIFIVFFFSSRRRHTRYWRDWSSDVCSSDLGVLDRGRTPSSSAADDPAPSAGYSATGERRLVGGCWRAGPAFWEIGRGSCGGRVEMSVVAVSLKKKQHL